ncbi:helix-turn-helix transcriptional regulator, partial [Mycobacterium avium]
GLETMTIENASVMLTAHEVRAMTGVPVSTLHEWAARRERGIDAPGPHHLRLSDRHRRWLLDDVKDWLESTRV